MAFSLAKPGDMRAELRVLLLEPTVPSHQQAFPHRKASFLGVHKFSLWITIATISRQILALQRIAADTSEASEQLSLVDKEKEWVEPVIATASLRHEGRVLHKAVTRIAMDHVC